MLPPRRVITDLPPPFSRKDTPYGGGGGFSAAAVEAAARDRCSLGSLRLAKMILVGDCGVGKTALVNR